jgi:hypothetical protein
MSKTVKEINRIKHKLKYEIRKSRRTRLVEISPPYTFQALFIIFLTCTKAFHKIRNNIINKMNCELMLTYDTPAASHDMGSYMKLVTKYQISAINSCWEKCEEKCAYMFIVYKNQLSRQTGSRNLKGPKTLPTIWHTYMKLVTKIWDSCHQ